jgi:hypothetical protein
MAFARYKGEAENALLAAGFPARLHLSARVYLPRGAAQGTEFQLPAAARDLPRVSDTVPQPGDSCRPTWLGQWWTSSSGNRGARQAWSWRTVTSEPWPRAFVGKGATGTAGSEHFFSQMAIFPYNVALPGAK